MEFDKKHIYFFSEIYYSFQLYMRYHPLLLNELSKAKIEKYIGTMGPELRFLFTFDELQINIIMAAK